MMVSFSIYWARTRCHIAHSCPVSATLEQMHVGVTFLRCAILNVRPTHHPPLSRYNQVTCNSQSAIKLSREVIFIVNNSLVILPCQTALQFCIADPKHESVYHLFVPRITGKCSNLLSPWYFRVWIRIYLQWLVSFVSLLIYIYTRIKSVAISQTEQQRNDIDAHKLNNYLYVCTTSSYMQWLTDMYLRAGISSCQQNSEIIKATTTDGHGMNMLLWWHHRSAHTCTHIHTYAHTYIHLHTHTRIHMHIHTRTRALSL